MSDEQGNAVTADTVPSLVSAPPPSSSKKKKSKKEKKRKHEDSPSCSSKKKHKKEKKKDKKDKNNKSEEQSGAAVVSSKDVTASSSQELSTPSRSDMPFQVKTVLGSVALLPSSLSNVPKTIKSLLHSLLLMYDANMGGVLLSLEDGIKLLPLKPRSVGGRSSNNDNNSNGLVGGRIVDDLPYVHYRFQFQGLLFCPMVGMKLKGQVIECTPTFITLTTNHILTTKISTEKLNQQGFFYNGVTLEWTRERVDTAMKQDTDDEDDVLGPSTSIYLDDTVEFIVERIHECGGYISLDGANPTV